MIYIINTKYLKKAGVIFSEAYLAILSYERLLKGQVGIYFTPFCNLKSLKKTDIFEFKQFLKAGYDVVKSEDSLEKEIVEPERSNIDLISQNSGIYFAEDTINFSAIINELKAHQISKNVLIEEDKLTSLTGS